MSRLTTPFFHAGALLVLLLALALPLRASAENRILFIGNSFTQGSGGARASAVGGVPGIFDRLVQAGGHENPHAVMRAVGGTDFAFHATNADTATAIQSEPWTHVIIQNYSTEPTHLIDGTHSLNAHFSNGKALYDLILANNPSTQVILYETFSRAWNHPLITGTSTPTTFASTTAFQAEIRANYQALADELNASHPNNPPVIVAPVGSSWENAGGLLNASEPGYVPLHGNDNYHGNDSGYYLAAAVFFAKIYGETPVGLSANPLVAGMNLDLTVTPRFLEETAWATAQGLRVSRLEAGETILLDFGADANTTPNNWNNITPTIGSNDNGLLENLVTSVGSASGVNFAMVHRFNGANTNGATGTGLFPDSATQDSLYGNTEAFNGLEAIFPEFTLTGLNPSTPYDLTFYAARLGVGDFRETLYTLTGSEKTEILFDPANNETNVAEAVGILPNVAGAITVSLTPGANNNNGNHFTYLGALKLTAQGGGVGGGDSIPPRVESAKTSNGLTIEIVFSEALDPTSANAATNYAVTNSDGVVTTISAVELQQDTRTVLLAVEEPLIGPFTIAVSGVTDLAGNAVAKGSTIGGVAPDPNATLIFIDFGGSQTVFEDPTGRQWNTIDGGVAGSDDGLMSGIIDSKGDTTSIELQMLSRFNGTNTNGTTDSTLFDPAATSDSLYGNTETFGNLENIFPKFKLTGLNPKAAYTLTFYASRMGVTDNRETGYKVEGASTLETTLNPSANIDAVAKVESMSPTAAGEITISLTPTANNVNGNHFTYLGVLQIEAVQQTETVSILEPPSNQTVFELEPAVFTVSALGEPPLTIQWLRNDAPIDGATELTYSIAATPLDWDNSQIRVRVSNATSTATSQPAILRVNPDTTAPQVLNTGSVDGKTLILNFSEPLNPAIAGDAANYSVSDSTVESVALSQGDTRVLITLTEPVSGPFTVDVSNVTDRVGNRLLGGLFQGAAPDPNLPTFLFDFGSPNTNVGVDDPFLTWNNLPASIGGTDDGVLETVLSSAGAPSPIQVQMLSRFNGTNTAGTTASALFPATASSDSLFGNTELFSELENIFPSFKLTGLDTNRAYTFTMYASRLGTGGDIRETGYTISGANEGFAALNVSENVNETVVVEGITPDSAGEIVVSIAPTENNTNTNHFTYLGVMKVETVLGKSFAITEVTRQAGGDVTLTWDSSPGEFFVVQHSLTLDANGWETISDLLPASAAPQLSTSSRVTTLPTDVSSFYRIAKVPPPALLEQDFEEGLGEWVYESNGITVGTDWEIGAPSDPPGAHEGTNVAGTGLTSDYADGLFNNGSGIALRSPVVDLTDKRTVVLSFWYFLDANDGQSGGQLKFLRADDLSTIPMAEQLLFVEPTADWTEFRFRLPQEVLDAGQILVEFEFISAPDADPSNNGKGWFIDEVILD